MAPFNAHPASAETPKNSIAESAQQSQQTD